MKSRAIVAMHHKTGTIWMRKTFRGICRKLDLVAHDFPDQNSPDELKAPCVVVDKHSMWFKKTRKREIDADDRVFHLVRDPRDVVISGMHYHRMSREAWLHKPDEKFGGLTYQQKINSFSDERSRYLFEMGNKAEQTISRMTEWDYDRPECFECKYEELMKDTEMSLFTEISRHLGFSDDELEICRQEFFRQSLFGEKRRKETKREPREQHVRSGQSRQWADVFDRDLATAFLSRFPDILVKLGYERDDSWVDNLKIAAAPQ
jgi:hypothetical protein